MCQLRTWTTFGIIQPGWLKSRHNLWPSLSSCQTFSLFAIVLLSYRKIQISAEGYSMTMPPITSHRRIACSVVMSLSPSSLRRIWKMLAWARPGTRVRTYIQTLMPLREEVRSKRLTLMTSKSLLSMNSALLNSFWSWRVGTSSCLTLKTEGVAAGETKGCLGSSYWTCNRKLNTHEHTLSIMPWVCLKYQPSYSSRYNQQHAKCLTRKKKSIKNHNHPIVLLACTTSSILLMASPKPY